LAGRPDHVGRGLLIAILVHDDYHVPVDELVDIPDGDTIADIADIADEILTTKG
jgi:hypothetical protein